MEISESTWAFIAKHRCEDVRDVALHAKRGDGIDLSFALEQIAGWQRASVKLPDWAACNGLIFPPQVPMEQCSSQFTAQYKARLAQHLLENQLADADASDSTSLVDLTGGFGVDFSYMARVFDHATYVERQSNLCDIARHNFPLLALAHAEVINDDSTAVLRQLAPVSMIFLDPARRDDHGSRTYAIADCTPDVLALQDLLLVKAPLVMVKLSPMLDWHKTVNDFAGAVHEVHIISTGNECKELLLVLERERCAAPRVVCVNDEQILEYEANHGSTEDADGIAHASSDGEEPLAGTRTGAIGADRWQYLYEPNASIMKAGCFAVISQRFDVHPIGPNSHLFVSAKPVDGFPGRSFAIESIATMNKRELKQALAGLTHANIAVRNFPLSVTQLRNKLKLKDGGHTYLFATTDAQGRHLVLRTQKQ